MWGVREKRVKFRYPYADFDGSPLDPSLVTSTPTRNVEGNINTPLLGNDIDSSTPLAQHGNWFVRTPARLAHLASLHFINLVVLLSEAPRAVASTLRRLRKFSKEIIQDLIDPVVNVTGWLGEELIIQRIFSAFVDNIWYIWCTLLLLAMHIGGILLVVFRKSRERTFPLMVLSAGAALTLVMSVIIRCMRT